MDLLDRSGRRLLHEQLAEVLIGNLPEFPVQSRFYTDREVCRKFKVSPYVARAALAKLVADGYVKRVISKGTYVQAHHSARKSPSRTMNIAVFSPLIARSPHTDAVEAMVAFMRGHEYSVFINSNQHHLQVDPEVMADLVVEVMGKVDGVIWISSVFEELKRIPDRLKKYADRIVFINAFTYIPGFTCVIRDEVGAVYNLTTHLLAHGYRRLAYIGGPKDRFISTTRLEGFTKAVQSAGLEPDPALVQRFTDGLLDDAGYAGMKKILESGPRPEAVVCVTDNCASGAVACLRDHQIRVPEEIAVTGFDNNLILAELRELNLTTIDLDYHRLGARAAEVLFAQMAGEQPGGARILEPCALVVRRSCGCGAGDRRRSNQ